MFSDPHKTRLLVLKSSFLEPGTPQSVSSACTQQLKRNALPSAQNP